MIPELRNATWNEIRNINPFTENTVSNKERRSKKTARILLAAIQVTENYIKGIKRLNAYDASSIIRSSANWIKTGRIGETNIKIKIGNVYYIDFGNAFRGELSYYHYGLCVGKQGNKMLVVPMRTGADIFETAYHKENKPDGKRIYRKALKEEGFNKDCVLLINDIKYISIGRIKKYSCTIDKDVVNDIKEQACKLMFPNVYNKLNVYQNSIASKDDIIKNQNKKISDLEKIVLDKNKS